jgi:hypothetical protein
LQPKKRRKHKLRGHLDMKQIQAGENTLYAFEYVGTYDFKGC